MNHISVSTSVEKSQQLVMRQILPETSPNLHVGPALNITRKHHVSVLVHFKPIVIYLQFQQPPSPVSITSDQLFTPVNLIGLNLQYLIHVGCEKSTVSFIGCRSTSDSEFTSGVNSCLKEPWIQCVLVCSFITCSLFPKNFNLPMRSNSKFM